MFFILILSAPGAGAFSGDFTTNLARQCRAFSRALKIEKLKAPLFRAELQMSGALLEHLSSIMTKHSFCIMQEQKCRSHFAPLFLLHR